jgi:hypothetical protein
MKGTLTMSTLSQKQHAATEVLVMADKWVDDRQCVKAAQPQEKARAAGRYEESGRMLEKAVLKYRKAGKKAGD